MSYDYATEKPQIFTEEGQVNFLKIRDRTHALLKTAGAARVAEMIAGALGDSWQALACVDRMVELGEIREVTAGQRVAGQYRVFVAAD